MDIYGVGVGGEDLSLGLSDYYTFLVVNYDTILVISKCNIRIIICVEHIAYRRHVRCGSVQTKIYVTCDQSKRLLINLTRCLSFRPVEQPHTITERIWGGQTEFNLGSKVTICTTVSIWIKG